MKKKKYSKPKLTVLSLSDDIILSSGACTSDLPCADDGGCSSYTCDSYCSGICPGVCTDDQSN